MSFQEGTQLATASSCFAGSVTAARAVARAIRNSSSVFINSLLERASSKDFANRCSAASNRPFCSSVLPIFLFGRASSQSIEANVVAGTATLRQSTV